eukprot:538307-Prymnesium_polylepis.2
MRPRGHPRRAAARSPRLPVRSAPLHRLASPRVRHTQPRAARAAAHADLPFRSRPLPPPVVGRRA